jgi:polysaccharide export outer membrane protein
MKNIIVFFLLFALVAFGCSSSEEIAKENLTQIMRSGSKPIQAETQADNYVIRRSDQVQVKVWGYPEFDATVPVKETGAITMPLLGDLAAVGLTKEQLVDQLKQKLTVYIQGEVKLTVTITSTVTQKVAVLGEVSKQENYPLMFDSPLIEVLTAAGGTTADSDLRHVKILRGGMNRQPIEVDLTWYMENGNVEAIPMVRPGDTIFVPRKANIIRDLSDFMRDAIFIFGFFRVFN